jgi:hypothetical protein
MATARRVAFALVLLAACDRHSGSAPAAPASAIASPSSSPAGPGAVSCGALECTQYASARDAFLDAIGGAPLVVALGEAHALQGATVASAAKHFSEELLPLLAGRASDLLVELMMPPTGCAPTAIEVRRSQAPATSRQADTNRGEYVTMGERARALGVVPDMLRPSCADLDAVRRAGDEAISASLEMIARLSAAQAERLIERDARSDADRGKTIVVYGGMLHNDLAPSPQKSRYSYAPRLDAYVHGRLVAIDLVVPEHIGDDETWRAFAWWPHYDRTRLGGKATRFRTGERSFVIVFPETRP